MNLAQELYDRLPVLPQHLATSAVGAQKVWTRYGLTYRRHRKWLEEFDQWSYDDRLKYQDSQVRALVHYAASHSPFYAGLYADIDVESVAGVRELLELPTVTKEDLLAGRDSIFTVRRGLALTGHTGGTSGRSLQFRITRGDMQRRMAMLDHFKARHGFENRRMKRASFMAKHVVPSASKSGVFWRLNWPAKQMLYSVYHLSERNLDRYIQSLNRWRPHSIDGFPSSIATVADYVLRNGLPLTFRPIAVFTTAENLSLLDREKIEKAFQTRVFDQYASSEGAPFVTECTEGQLHVELSTGVVEQSPDNKGEILITSFTSHGTPLINYAIGDSMTLSDTLDCRCGITSQIVARINGRSNDFLYKADGGHVNSVQVARLVRHGGPGVIRAQLVQDRLAEVEMIIQTDPDLFGETDEQSLNQEFMRQFGSETHLTIVRATEIPQEPSGKVRLIKNSVSQPSFSAGGMNLSASNL